MVDKTLVLEERAAVLQKKADRFDQLQAELETARTEVRRVGRRDGGRKGRETGEV